MAVLSALTVVRALLAAMSTNGWSVRPNHAIDAPAAWLLLALLVLFLATLPFRPSRVFGLSVMSLLLLTFFVFMTHTLVALTCLGAMMALGLTLIAAAHAYRRVFLPVVLVFVLGLLMAVRSVAATGLDLVSYALTRDVTSVASLTSPNGRWQLVTIKDTTLRHERITVVLRTKQWFGCVDRSKRLYEDMDGSVPRTRWADSRTVEIGGVLLRPFQATPRGAEAREEVPWSVRR